MSFIRVAIVVGLFFFQGVVHAQPDRSKRKEIGFEDVDKQEAQNAILDFAANREKFQMFGCRGKIESFKQPLSNLGVDESEDEYRFCVFEDNRKKLYRADWESVVNSKYKGLRSLFRNKSDQRVFFDGREFNKSSDIEMLLMRGWNPGDCWAFSFTSYAGFRLKEAETLYWMKMFDPQKLLWAQENSTQLRGEWDIGPNSRVQVYFDKELDNIPIFCRYINRPSSTDVKFSNKAKTYVNEIETTWRKHGNGLVPVSIRNYYENINSSGKPQSMSCIQIRLDWETNLIDGEILDERVFQPNKLSYETLTNSFRDR